MNQEKHSMMNAERERIEIVSMQCPGVKPANKTFQIYLITENRIIKLKQIS